MHWFQYKYYSSSRETNVLTDRSRRAWGSQPTRHKYTSVYICKYIDYKEYLDTLSRKSATPALLPGRVDDHAWWLSTVGDANDANDDNDVFSISRVVPTYIQQ